MNSYLVMGLFALHVVAVSLVRYLREDEFFRLTAMKRLWGRSRGLIFHFLANVALPMVLGIVFITQAAVHAPTAVPASGNLASGFWIRRSKANRCLLDPSGTTFQSRSNPRFPSLGRPYLPESKTAPRPAGNLHARSRSPGIGHEWDGW